MELYYIEDLINRENIKLINTYLEDAEGAFVRYAKINIIFYDKSKIQNSKRKKEIFSEELGHYYYDATYKFNSDNYFIDKQEYRAKKASYNMLIPFEKLKSAILKRN